MREKVNNSCLPVGQVGKSRFTLAVFGGFLVGIFLADKIMLGFAWEIGVIFGLIVAATLLRQDKLCLLGVIALTAFFLGLIYYHFCDFREQNKKLVYEDQSSVEGIVISKPEVTETQKFVIRYRNTKVLIQTGKFPEYYYGDMVRISGNLTKPYPENYYFRKGIRGSIKNPEKIETIGNRGNIIIKSIYFIVDKFETSINRILSEPYAALQNGILLGAKKNLPDSLTSAFNRVGLSHIVVASGYNVMIIISALSLILAPVSRKIAFWGSFLGIIVIVILTGGASSIIRAGILAALVLWCKVLGRRPYYPILILFVAFLMNLFNPYILKNDISFQLSFLAFVGLLFISPRISQLRTLENWPNLLRITFSETLGAQIMVLPLLIFYFGNLSLFAPLINILIVPIVSYSMFFGFLAGLGGLIWVSLGKILSIPAFLILKYIIVVTEGFNQFSWVSLKITVSQWWWIPTYFLIIYLIFKGRKADLEKEEY